jgi:hypothetical protein
MTNEFSPRAEIWTTLAIAAFVLVVALLTSRAISRVNQPGVRYPEIDPEAWVLRDFRDAVYYPVRAIADGISPYHVRNYVEKYPVGQDFPPYSPLTLVVHYPFGLVSLPVAEWTYFVLTIALTMFLAWFTLKLSNLPRFPAAVIALTAGLLASRPGHMNLLLGQTTVPLIIMTLAALHFSAKDKPWLSGFCAAISTLKPTYGICLLPLMFSMGHRKAAIRGGLLSVSITLPLALWIVWLQGGVQESIEIAMENAQVLYDNPGRDPSQSFSRVDVMALGARCFRSTFNSKLEFVVTGIVIGLGCLVLFRASPRFPPIEALLPAGIFALLALLIGSYHHAYDAILLIPILIAAMARSDEFWRRWSKPMFAIWCGLIAIPLVNYAATNTFIDKFQLTRSAWNIVTALNSAALLIATVWLGIALLRGQQNQSRTTS